MPRHTHKPTPLLRRQVEAMAGYGVPEKDIGGVVGIDPKTLRKHYRQELDHGHVKANAAKIVAGFLRHVPELKPEHATGALDRLPRGSSGGIDFARGKKWRDAQQNPKVTLLIDDFDPPEAHALEIRGDAELHETGGSKINPRFPNFVEPFIRLRPTHVVSWGLNAPVGTAAKQVPVSSRSVRR